MKKVAFGLMVVVSCMWLLSACSKSSGDNGSSSNTVCNSFGQCYSTNSTCGNINGSPWQWAGTPYNSNCIDTRNGSVVQQQYCSAVGAGSVGTGNFGVFPGSFGAFPGTLNGSLYNPSCNPVVGNGFIGPNGLPINTFGATFTGFGSQLGGCPFGVAYDPFTGVNQCAVPPMMPIATPSFIGGGAFFYLHP